MKKENFERLKKFEDNFTTAVYADWSRNLPLKDQELLEEIWSEETNYDKLFTSHNCSECLMHGLKVIGRWYFTEKQKMIDSKKEEKIEEPTLTKSKKVKKA